MAAETYDISPQTLAWARAHSPTPRSLDELVRLSRKYFGWFSRQCARAFEQPWVLEQIGKPLFKPVLDIGAGVSPLPILLAQRGIRVVTVDHSATIRQYGRDEKSWNDWGYLDYRPFHSNLTSYHEDILTIAFPEAHFSVIYSLSVVEHMPAAVRRQVWDRVVRWLGPEGVLLLTVDLNPGTDQLWNRSQGKQIEDQSAHGDLATLLGELSAVGARCIKQEFLRNVPDARGDVAMLRFEWR